MDTNKTYRLIIIGIILIIIGIGAVMTYTGNYLAAPEQKRQSRVKFMRRCGVVLVISGLGYLIYSKLS